MYDITDKRNAIREIQRYLLEIAWGTVGIPRLGIDGIYGEETREAVRRFQERNALPVTGEVAYRDWEAIYATFLRARDARLADPRLLPPAALPLLPRARGDDVLLLQLILLGLSPRHRQLSGVQRTGVYDQGTASAVRAYQTERGLPSSGITDAETWAALTEDYRALRREAPPA